MERIYHRKSRKISTSESECSCPIESLNFFKTIDGFENLAVDGMRLAHCYIHHRTRCINRKLAASIECKREQGNSMEGDNGDIQRTGVTAEQGQGVLFGV